MSDIKVLLATQAQKESLEGFYEQGYELKFVEDANGDWVVNDKVVTNGHFLSIRKQLEALPIINFQPKIIE
jgi:hypothetical protein